MSVAIISLNLLNQYMALQIATSEGSDALAGLFADMHAAGYLIAQVFFGLWLLPLGYLVYRSGLFPRAIGVLLTIGCFGYLADTFVQFLARSIAESIEPFVVAPAAVGELSLVVWLLVKGVRVVERRAPAPAFG